MPPMPPANCTDDRLAATRGACVAAAHVPLPLTLVIASTPSSFANVEEIARNRRTVIFKTEPRISGDWQYRQRDPCHERPRGHDEVISLRRRRHPRRLAGSC